MEITKEDQLRAIILSKDNALIEYSRVVNDLRQELRELRTRNRALEKEVIKLKLR